MKAIEYLGENRLATQTISNSGTEVTLHDGGNRVDDRYYAFGRLAESRNGSNQTVQQVLWDAASGGRTVVWIENNGDVTIGNDTTPDTVASGENSETPADARYFVHADSRGRPVAVTVYDAGGTNNGRIVERILYFGRCKTSVLKNGTSEVASQAETPITGYLLITGDGRPAPNPDVEDERWFCQSFTGGTRVCWDSAQCASLRCPAPLVMAKVTFSDGSSECMCLIATHTLGGPHICRVGETFHPRANRCIPTSEMCTAMNCGSSGIATWMPNDSTPWGGYCECVPRPGTQPCPPFHIWHPWTGDCQPDYGGSNLPCPDGLSWDPFLGCVTNGGPRPWGPVQPSEPPPAPSGPSGGPIGSTWLCDTACAMCLGCAVSGTLGTPPCVVACIACAGCLTTVPGH